MICAECKQVCEDTTEYSGLKTDKGLVAVHRWCIETLIERIRTLKPYESIEFPPECQMGGGGWQSTIR